SAHRLPARSCVDIAETLDVRTRTRPAGPLACVASPPAGEYAPAAPGSGTRVTKSLPWRPTGTHLSHVMYPMGAARRSPARVDAGRETRDAPARSETLVNVRQRQNPGARLNCHTHPRSGRWKGFV